MQGHVVGSLLFLALRGLVVLESKETGMHRQTVYLVHPGVFPLVALRFGTQSQQHQ